MLLTDILQPTTFLPLEILLESILNSLGFSYCVTFVVGDDFHFKTTRRFSVIDPNNASIDYLMYQILYVSEEGCSDFVVRIKEPKTFMKAFERSNTLQKIRRSDKKIIFLPYENTEQCVERLLEILPMKETSYVANVLLVVPEIQNVSGCIRYDLVTHTFEGLAKAIGEPKYLDRWDSCRMGFEKRANLFPHDLTNLEGKVLKLSCFPYKPFIVLDLDTSVVPMGRDGVEIRIVDEFCKWINCTIELVRKDEEQWGQLFNNKTGKGILGFLIEDKVDMSVTALYSWYEEFIWLDFSAATLKSLITCLAPAPRLLVTWELPLLPFQWEMWIGMVMTFIFSALAITYVQKSSDKAFLTAFGMMTAQVLPLDKVHKIWRMRSVTGWVIVTGLILCSAYGAGLASTFTVPKYEQPIDTIQDLLERKMEWGATHDAWIYSLTLSIDPLAQQLVKLFRVYSFEELKAKSFTRSLAFSINQLPAGSYAVGDYITAEAISNLRLMKGSFYYEQNVVMLRKSSPYTEKMDDFIGRLHQSGLLLAWEDIVTLKYLDTKVQLQISISQSNQDATFGPLSLRHVVGIFYFYSLGVGFSIILFIIEVVYDYILFRTQITRIPYCD